ncbi:pilus assembly protein [Ramlibacter tataouinensis]|uniref:PilY1 beta-propeller domain-containing protein n=1 Tax=Ramlibacter tataouinensis (strain ATCC BAA-407 / DSM 14655 / LMG 21543 / TTB310) TaxID=365046 RepID=F5Y1R8_RAMTT|nr:PilC/PilY family type IV pilus protein [Ramlibacter tataouinensis]AEG92319.1 conserved hypothetical protein [Ramlibacter tataouinensis TTB310]
MTHLFRRIAPGRGTVVLAALALAFGGALAQKIDDVPPAVQNNVAPNFMFMIDNSGSMNNIVPAAPYSPSATYFGNCSSPIPIPPSGANPPSIDIRVVDGEPRFVSNGTTYRHVTVDSRGRCFHNNVTYSARLLGNGGSSDDRMPTGYLDSEYSGHFLNWYFGNYGGPVTGWGNRKRLASGLVETRMEIARRAAKSTIDSLPVQATGARPVVRVGLSSYRRTSDGGALRVDMSDFNAALRSSLKTSIDALQAEASTPLASTLADIGRYLATGYNGDITTARTNSVNIDTLLRLNGTDNATRNACLAGAASCTGSSSPRPIQYWCQRSSIFAMTDGRPQSDRAFNSNTYIRDYDGDCSGVNDTNCVNKGAAGSWDRKIGRTYESAGSDYMDDVAKLLFDADWRPDLAKPAPTGSEPRAKNNISTYMIGFADPTVQNDPLLINTARQGGGKFIAATDSDTLVDAFRTVIADAIAKDAAAAAVAVTNAQITAGTVGYASSYKSGSWYGDLEAYSLDITTGLQNGTASWFAKDRLNAMAPASRKIASWNGTTGVPFTTASGTALRATTPGLTDALIDYTRGVRHGEDVSFRARTFLLGDIINAEPVVVNYPAGPVVYQAANDGMLHAFDGRVEASADTRGQELWAYVPRLIHGKLAGRASLAFEHEYLVDGTPATAAVTGVGDVRHLLVGGLGKGGAGFYALDVTSGTAATEADAVAKVLWEFRPANMGYSFGIPLIVNTSAGWRVVVTSGLRNDTGSEGLGGDGRGRVWVLNPANGNVEKEFITPAGFGSAAAGLGLAHLAKPANLAASAVVRHVYGGDLQGNVWRFDLNAPTLSAPVRVAAAVDRAGLPQPITAPPVVSPVLGSATRMFIYFGTGQYFSIDDVPGTGAPNANASQQQTIYGIVDDTSVASPALPDIRGSNGASCPSNGGNGELVCQFATQSTPGGPINVSHNAVDLSSRRGFYLDIPIAGGRVNTQPALTAGGTLVIVVNQPSNADCNPGGSSYLFQLSAATGGAVIKTPGGSDYYDSVFFIANALSSRPVIVITANGPRALLRLSDKTTQSREIDETANSNPAFRRIYMRPLN